MSLDGINVTVRNEVLIKRPFKSTIRIIGYVILVKITIYIQISTLWSGLFENKQACKVLFENARHLSKLSPSRWKIEW